MTKNITISTTIEPPLGTGAGDWQHDNGREYRLLYGSTRTIPGRDDVYVQATAAQFGDGSIDDGSAVEGPGVHVGVADRPLTVEQARRLALRSWPLPTTWRRSSS